MKKNNILTFVSFGSAVLAIILIFLLPLITIEYHNYSDIVLTTQAANFYELINGAGVIFGGQNYSMIVLDTSGSQLLISSVTHFNGYLLFAVILAVITLAGSATMFYLKKFNKINKVIVGLYVACAFLVFLTPIWFYFVNTIETWLADVTSFDYSGMNVHNGYGSIVVALLFVISAMTLYLALPKSDEGAKK